MTTVLLDSGIDAGAPWHFGDPMREQRLLDSGDGAVDLSHRGVVTVTGPDRLSWLHSLTTQHLDALQPGLGVTTLVLSPQGHIEHVLYGVDDGETFWAHTEPGAAGPLVAWLDRMRFLMRVEVADRTDAYAVVWTAGNSAESNRGASGAGTTTRVAADSLGGRELFVPRDQLSAVLSDAPRAGMWAYEARRIAAGVPRIGLDTDHRTIPNEVGLLGVAVHLDKGCYRGQETVARVHTLGRPPRRLVRLHLDGSVDALPEPGTVVELDGRPVGFVGGTARNYELGPIGLGLLKRNVDPEAELLVAGIAAGQEALVDPEVGLHVRPQLRS
ncbi:MAG TPA: folate-binding protein [Propionibacteriaceae bacterium]|nr:folate-binding protein [Propionibacteriaceae bacterium]